MVALQKLWGNGKFKSLPPLCKLIYIHLAHHPSITTLGVVTTTYDDLNGLIGDPNDLDMIHEVVEYLDMLHTLDFISYVPEDSFLVAVVRGHWKSLPNSKAQIRKALQEGREAKGDLKTLLRGLFTPADFEQPMAFKPPTAGQVADYALSKGYLVNGKDFVDHYASNDWYNTRGKKVRSWKRTLEKVWCREENKLEQVKGAPKGFEFLYIELEDGTRVAPEGWKNGLPTHSNFIYAEMLTAKFKNLNV